MNNEEDQINKRRRIIIDDDEDDDDDVVSNPDEIIDDSQGIVNQDEEEGEDLEEHWLADYAPAPELDYYDPNVLAKDDDPALYESYEKRVRDRMAAEEALDAMDIKRREREIETEYNLERVNRFEQEELEDIDEDDDEAEEEGREEEYHLNLEAFECPLREWIAEERTCMEIKRRFRKFLLTYYEGSEEVNMWKQQNAHLDPVPPLPPHLKQLPPIYPGKIRSMCSGNRASLEVAYRHLAEAQSLLAIWLTDVPNDILEKFDEVLKEVVKVDFPHYEQIAKELHIRITDLPISEKLRDLRQSDLNSLIKVFGVVTRRTGVFPQMLAAAYTCEMCNAQLGPFRLTGVEIRPEECPNCGNRGSFKINQQRTTYGNFQKINLQETPGSVPPGRVPRYKEVVLCGDLIDIARPGEEIEVTGIYQYNQQTLSKKSNGFPVFSTVIIANNVQKRHGNAGTYLSEEDKRKIRELATDPRIGERIIRSIAPSIYGHRHVKTGVALSLFGGCHKDGGVAGGMHRVRGDINLLLLGDPGTAKSQILKYSEKTAPRSVYTAGKGASAVGLTAGVHRDPLTKEWTLEGGALVLADQGVCLIDEFDKMNEQDRTSIHEAMEQQTISVSKAGIVTSLQARCAVIAAANPIGGRYDPSYSFAENVELTDPILQRFDVLCVLQDIVDPVVDERLASFVVNSHMRSHPDYIPENNENKDDNTVNTNNSKGYNESKSSSNEYNNNTRLDVNSFGDGDDDGPKPLDQETLRKYIAYARANIKPILHDIDSEKIASLYAELRTQSSVTGGIPIAVRHIESIMRMSEASAKMHLREYVREDDIDLAIKVMLESFLQAQKISVRKLLQRSFKKYLTYGEASNQLLLHKLQGLIVETEKFNLIRKGATTTTTTTNNNNNDNKNIEVFISDLENRARELNIFDLTPFFNSKLFKSHNMTVNYNTGIIIKHYL